VLGHESINVSQQDFTPLMTGIKAKNPDMLYFGGTTQSKGGQIAKDMIKVGLACPLMVPDGCYEKSFIESAGADNLGNCYATMGGVDWPKLEGPGLEYVKRYRAKYGDPEAIPFTDTRRRSWCSNRFAKWARRTARRCSQQPSQPRISIKALSAGGASTPTATFLSRS